MLNILQTSFLTDESSYLAYLIGVIVPNLHFTLNVVMPRPLTYGFSNYDKAEHFSSTFCFVWQSCIPRTSRWSYHLRSCHVVTFNLRASHVQKYQIWPYYFWLPKNPAICIMMALWPQIQFFAKFDPTVTFTFVFRQNIGPAGQNAQLAFAFHFFYSPVILKMRWRLNCDMDQKDSEASPFDSNMNVVTALDSEK